MTDSDKDAMFGKDLRVYDTKMNKQSLPDTIEIDGVKYQKVKEPKKPQTPDSINEVKEELERWLEVLREHSVEQSNKGVVSSVDKKPQTLYDVISDWWSDIFTTGWDAETCIDNLVDEISLWLPKPQSAAGSQNVYVECSVEGYNDCLNEIRGKLR